VGMARMAELERAGWVLCMFESLR